MISIIKNFVLWVRGDSLNPLSEIILTPMRFTIYRTINLFVFFNIVGGGEGPVEDQINIIRAQTRISPLNFATE